MTHKGWHHAYDTHYHVVFPVKYRKALLREEITGTIKEIAQEITERYDIDIEQLGTDQDHIHILVSFPPTMSGGDFVKIFKSVTATELFKQFPELKKELWGGNFWSAGYYLATVSEHGNWKIVESYVKNQGIEGNTDNNRQLQLL